MINLNTGNPAVLETLDVPGLHLVVDATDEWNDISDSYDVGDEKTVPAGSVLLRTIYINSAPFHVNAIRVNNDGEQRAAAEEGLVQGELESWFGVYEYAWITVNIEGYEGDYVILIHPHGD